jgi:hypothetical protein
LVNSHWLTFCCFCISDRFSNVVIVQVARPVRVRFILVVLALTSFRFMLQLITILNFHEGRLTPGDENAWQSWIGDKIESVR